MKKIILVIIAFAAISFTAEAQSKTSKATFEVDGVCKMCKDRIEKAALTTKGVKFASWNIEKKELYCIFNNKKTSLMKLKQVMADAGHDTKEIKATDEAYGAIDECCKYRTLETH
ncbi:heavy-metal-associated domain-containing protein [Aureibaculum conchae]|uniref:heavy-metal-associated domain-containing protein n=1 Tax=Aureibaculum sp. 2308TA14-22 TaxID=3108392 RepID=UPI003394930A